MPNVRVLKGLIRKEDERSDDANPALCDDKRPHYTMPVLLLLVIFFASIPSEQEKKWSKQESLTLLPLHPKSCLILSPTNSPTVSTFAMASRWESGVSPSHKRSRVLKNSFTKLISKMGYALSCSRDKVSQSTRKQIYSTKKDEQTTQQQPKKRHRGPLLGTDGVPIPVS